MTVRFFILTILSFFLTLPVYAESLIEPDYDGHSPKVTTPWYENYNEANYNVDQNFITGMRPHHAGALTMSRDYLASPEKSSARLQALSRGIIANQTFEIGMLNRVEELINAAPLKTHGAGYYQVAEQGLAMKQRFMRSPAPVIFNESKTTSAEDVRFAKAMIVHHEGALMMCDNYLDNPDTNNGYVERMCLDVLRDQAQEIALMHAIINDYPGNSDAIRIDPSMIHGMDDMMHHMDFSSVQPMDGQHKTHSHAGH